MNATTCAVCGLSFPSRNRLFAHLNDSGHGVASSSSSGKKGDDANDGGIGGDDVVGDGDGNNDHDDGPPLAKGNDAYRAYYLRQRICNLPRDGNDGNEDDDAAGRNERAWADAYRRLRTPLPVSYRVHESTEAGGDFAVGLLSLVDEKREGRGADDGAEGGTTFREWSFDGSGSDGVPRLRMAVAPHVRRRRSNNGKKRRRGEGEEDGGDASSSAPLLHALQELGAVHRQELVR